MHVCMYFLLCAPKNWLVHSQVHLEIISAVNSYYSSEMKITDHFLNLSSHNFNRFSPFLSCSIFLSCLQFIALQVTLKSPKISYCTRNALMFITQHLTHRQQAHTKTVLQNVIIEIAFVLHRKSTFPYTHVKIALCT